MAGIMMLVIGSAPKLLAWVLIIPIGFIYWVVRSKTEISDTGITATNAFKKPMHIPWSEIEGVGFRRATAFVQTTSKKAISLPGVSFNNLPELEKASTGRIPDALTQGRIAADEKVVIVYKDGRQVLLTKEEYEASKLTNDADNIATTSDTTDPDTDGTAVTKTSSDPSINSNPTDPDGPNTAAKNTDS